MRVNFFLNCTLVFIFFSLFYCPLLGKPVDYNLKFYGYSHHLDQDWFFHPGIQIDRDYYIKDWLIGRASVSCYEDSGGLVAGFFHLGFRINARKFNSMYVRLGFGPSFIWRQNWWVHKSETYQGNSFYGTTPHFGRFEYAFLFYGGDIEIEWRLKSGKRVVYALIPGYPVIFANSVGIRF